MANIVTMIFTILSGVGACLACVISYTIYRRQRNIALFELRMKILTEIEAFVYYEVTNWDWDGGMSIFLRYPTEEVTALFDAEFNNTYMIIYEKAKNISNLHGDEKYAQRHDTCNGLTLEEIQGKIEEECQYIEDIYTEEKRRVIGNVVKV